MHWGQAFGSCWGSEENHIKRQSIKMSADGTYFDYTFECNTDFADMFYGIYLNAKHPQNDYK